MYKFLGYIKKGKNNFPDVIIKKFSRVSLEKINKNPPLIDTDRYMFIWNKPYKYRGMQYKVTAYFYENKTKLRIYLENYYDKKDYYTLYYKFIEF